MKKILVAVFALCLASPVMATVGVEFGTNWYKVQYTYNTDDHLMGQGQNMLVFWGIDNDITIGAYVESNMISDQDGNVYSFDGQAIQLTKGILKNVAIGLNIGQMYNEWNYEVGQFTDVFGAVTILSGSSEKVAGLVKAAVGARFYTDDSEYTFDGVVVNLSVGLGF